MSQTISLAIFPASHQTVISWINQQLNALGLAIETSFNLQSARTAHPDCTCPHHGAAQCDCQIMILLVYEGQDAPVTLVVHSQDGWTYLTMTDALSDGLENNLAGKIVYALNHQDIKF